MAFRFLIFPEFIPFKYTDTFVYAVIILYTENRNIKRSQGTTLYQTLHFY